MNMKALIRHPVIWFLLGMSCFYISQPLIRIPLLTAAMQTTQFTVWGMKSPISLIVAIALSAGLFEETARWLYRRWLIRPWEAGVAQPLVFGLGHGFMEVLFLFGPAWTLMLAMDSLPIAITERVLAMIAHVFFTFLIWEGFRRGQAVRYWLIAVLLHGLMDIVAGLSGVYGWSPWLTEGMFAVYDIFALIYIVRAIRGWKKVAGPTAGPEGSPEISKPEPREESEEHDAEEQNK